MKLSQRLAFRRAPAKPASRPAASDGFGHAVHAFACGNILGVDAPAGFEHVVLPSAEEIASTLGEVGGPEHDSPDPACPAIALDLETSGLDPVQCVPFIACAAWHEGGRLVIEQWTLHEGRAERPFLAAFLARLAEVARPGTRLLSFNGKSFDLPRLRGRLGRLGLQADVLEQAHVDLVGPARRLYRGVHPDCRLTTLERQILGVHRRGDLQGAEVAAVWDQLQAYPNDAWVRGELALAESHNRADLLGLFALVPAIAAAVRSPRGLAAAMGVARHWVALEVRARALDVLAPVVEGWGDTPAQNTERFDALMLLAELHRRGGAFDAAAGCWERACSIRPGEPTAHEALAKHLEHRARRLDEALAVASASKAPCDRRIERLRAKLARLGSSGGEVRAAL